ncbi:hypothetical protein M422DRAFT_66057 [Sphaerobolus stellatus SS14]|nr:hypothetical protein M422DRAFT_66057 [Sphaerobolus stellatus SS14]
MVLPVETWRECWLHNDPNDLCNLSLVSKTFRAICQPLLFQKLIFRAPGLGVISKRTCIKWVLTLFKSTERMLNLHHHRRLAGYVHEWEFHGNKERDLAWGLPATYESLNQLESSYRQVIMMFKTILPSFLHLKRLVLYEISLTEDDIQVLSQLPCLHTLELFNMEYISTRCQVPLKLRKFFIDGLYDRIMEDTPSLEIISPEKVEELTLRSRPYNIPCLSFLKNQGGCPLLITLSVTPALKNGMAVIEALFALLAVCPQLLELRFLENGKDSTASLMLPSLPGTAVPLLNFYSGPPSIAVILAPGRPIKCMQLYSTPYPWTMEETSTEMKTILNKLTQTSVPIEDLTILTVKTSPEIFILIHDLYPNLRQLSVPLMHEGVDGSDSDSSSSSSSDDSSSSSSSEDSSSPSDDASSSSEDYSSSSDDSSSSNSSSSEDSDLEDGIADIVVKEDGTPVHGLGTFTLTRQQGIMDALALNIVPLPARIQKIGIYQDYRVSSHIKFSLPKQRRFIAEISRIYPCLHENTGFGRGPLVVGEDEGSSEHKLTPLT